jgi:hypothetical protein
LCLPCAPRGHTRSREKWPWRLFMRVLWARRPQEKRRCVRPDITTGRVARASGTRIQDDDGGLAGAWRLAHQSRRHAHCTRVNWSLLAPVLNILEDEGRTLLLTNPQHMRAVPGKKTDVDAHRTHSRSGCRAAGLYGDAHPTRSLARSTPSGISGEPERWNWRRPDLVDAPGTTQFRSRYWISAAPADR